MELSHIDNSGNAKMVNISTKDFTHRTATAKATVVMAKATLDMIIENKMPKGDVFSCARIAGIMGAKKTFELIPMCHPLPIDSLSIEFEIKSDTEVVIIATAVCTYKTGIEMEAMTACTIAALTVYDMCKAVDKKISIEGIHLYEKTGGKSGHFINEY